MDDPPVLPAPIVLTEAIPYVHKASGEQPDGTRVDIEVHHNPVEL